MNYPIQSFLIAILIWFFALFSWINLLKKIPEQNQVSLEIEASAIEAQSHEDHVSGKNFTAEKKHNLTNNNQQNSAYENLVAIHNPLPEIPDDLREEAFNSTAVARFYIDEKGAVTKVELIKPCNNPKLNHLLLKSLQNWKFNPSNKASAKEIKVNFEVK